MQALECTVQKLAGGEKDGIIICIQVNVNIEDIWRYSSARKNISALNVNYFQ